MAFIWLGKSRNPEKVINWDYAEQQPRNRIQVNGWVVVTAVAVIGYLIIAGYGLT